MNRKINESPGTFILHLRVVVLVSLLLQFGVCSVCNNYNFKVNNLLLQKENFIVKGRRGK